MISDIDNVLRFKIKNYFLNYYLIVSEKVGKQNAGANWAEYVEYGTTDDIIIELQNIGLPRHLSMMIKDDYIDFLTFEDGMLVDLNARELIENIDCKKYKNEIEELKEMTPEDICIIAVPSYGGRVPEPALKEIDRKSVV